MTSHWRKIRRCCKRRAALCSRSSSWAGNSGSSSNVAQLTRLEIPVNEKKNIYSIYIISQENNKDCEKTVL